MKLRLSRFGAFVQGFHEGATINHAQLLRPWVNCSLLNMDDFTPRGSGDAESARRPSAGNEVRGLRSSASVSQPWTLPLFPGSALQTQIPSQKERARAGAGESGEIGLCPKCVALDRWFILSCCLSVSIFKLG